MREIRLYDRDRTPASWMQIIRPGEFAVFHSQIKGGAMTDAAGTFTAAGEEVCALFGSLQKAEDYCAHKVRELPALRCEIFDSSGKARPPLRVMVNPALHKKLDVSPASARSKLFLGAVLCLSSLVFFYLDYRGEGRSMMFLFTLIGINLALGGFRVIVWGLGVRQQLKDQERRRVEILSSASQSATSRGQ